MKRTRIKYIVAEGLDVNFFSNKEYAEKYYEAVDVAEGIFRGYDSDGRLLNITPRGQASEITIAENEPMHIEDLAKLLNEFLVAVGRTPEKDDIGSLLELCEPFCIPSSEDTIHK